VEERADWEQPGIHPGIFLSGVPPFSDLRDAAILCCLGIDGQWNFLLHSELRLEEILITITDPLACYAATNTSQIWG